MAKSKPHGKKGNKQKSKQIVQQKKAKRKVALYVMGTILAIFLAVFSYGFWHTSQREFCATCHYNQQSVESLANSKHAEAGCKDCHWPGPLGIFDQKISLVNEVYSFYTNSYGEPINGDGHISKNMKDEACIKCHNDRSKLDASKKMPLMNHEIHAKKKVSCATCHNRAGHPGIEGCTDNTGMKGCFRCHSITEEAKAPGKCATCHAKNFNLKPSNHSERSWSQAEHAAASHGESRDCNMCHLDNFCIKCHGISLPHSSEFSKDHVKAGTDNPNMCRKCHKQQDFCNACHHYGFNGAPGTWISNHAKTAVRKGSESCFQCHSPTYCATCHAQY